MKIVIFSDLHGSLDAWDLLVKNIFPEGDEIWCLGDVLHDYQNKENKEENAAQLKEKILKYDTKPLIIIKGNTDQQSIEEKLPFAKDMFVVKNIDKLSILLTHGHLFSDTKTPEELMEMHQCQMVIQGHTHEYKLEIKNGYIYANSGSTTYPADKKNLPTALILDTRLKRFQLRTINTNEIVEELYFS